MLSSNNYPRFKMILRRQGLGPLCSEFSLWNYCVYCTDVFLGLPRSLTVDDERTGPGDEKWGKGVEII